MRIPDHTLGTLRFIHALDDGRRLDPFDFACTLYVLREKYDVDQHTMADFIEWKREQQTRCTTAAFQTADPASTP